MTWLSILMWILCVLAVLGTYSSFDNRDVATGIFLVVMAVVFGWVAWYDSSPEGKASEARNKAEKAAAALAAATPHVIREADGCKVYAFEDAGRTHYFTRCPDGKVTTQSSYTVTCGKNCTKRLEDNIQTVVDKK